MSFRTTFDILELTKIPLERMSAFSLSNDVDEQNGMAEGIEQEYGMAGLRTLWMCQGLQCSTRTSSVLSSSAKGLTLATEWWLTTSSNSAAHLKNDFINVVSEDDANQLLGLCTRTPQLNLLSPQSDTLFVPEDCEDTASLLSAVHVRRLAQIYFPHLPQLALPLNHLYFNAYEGEFREDMVEEAKEREWDQVYHDPVGAFMDDPHALKYFASLNRSLPAHPPAWLVEFSKHGDPDWNMYKTLGISMEEAYHFAVQGAALTQNLSLPENLDKDTPMGVGPNSM